MRRLVVAVVCRSRREERVVVVWRQEIRYR